jgi:hypothetical protein
VAASVYRDFLRAALRVPALAVACFFAATLVLPLTTMGDPAFDIPLLRARWYSGFGVVWLHLALVLGLIWRMARHPGWAPAAGLIASATALILMLAEEGQLVQHGSLTLPHADALFRLNANRVMTALLSLAALIAVWRLNEKP